MCSFSISPGGIGHPDRSATLGSSSSSAAAPLPQPYRPRPPGKLASSRASPAASVASTLRRSLPIGRGRRGTTIASRRRAAARWRIILIVAVGMLRADRIGFGWRFSTASSRRCASTRRAWVAPQSAAQRQGARDRQSVRRSRCRCRKRSRDGERYLHRRRAVSPSRVARRGSPMVDPQDKGARTAAVDLRPASGSGSSTEPTAANETHDAVDHEGS